MGFASSGYGQVVIVLRCSTGLTHVLKISTVQCAFSFPPLKEKKKINVRDSKAVLVLKTLSCRHVSLLYLPKMPICAVVKASDGSFA